MHWQAITAIATSATVLAIVGIQLMLWVVNKPKVLLLSVSPIHWFCIYKNGTQLVGARITMNLRFKNDGAESTTIDGVFETDNGYLFMISEPVKLEGRGKVLDAFICLDLSNSERFPACGETLQGTLKLVPWGNKRLFWGKKYLIRKLNIPSEIKK